jgi:putative cell wall-binding protein
MHKELARRQTARILFNLLVVGGILLALSANHAQANTEGRISTPLAVTPGITITESEGETILSECGTADSYTVELATQPLADVTISIATDEDQATLSDTDLTFTSANWDTPQTVTVTPEADRDAEGTSTITITHDSSSADLTYDNLSIDDVEATILDCTRITGADATEQSINLSRTLFADHSADALIVARGDVIIDAFVAVPWAKLLNAPILLTTPDELSSETLIEAIRVLVNKNAPIFILGQEQAIHESVLNQFVAAGFNGSIRVGGQNRRETAAIIADHIVLGQSPTSRAFFTEDISMVDALSASAAAGLLSDDNLVDPILLHANGQDELDPATKAFFGGHPEITTLEMVGGTGTLPAGLEQTIQQELPYISTINRSGGINRYETSALLAAHFFPAPQAIVVARGEREALPGARSLGIHASDPLVSALLAGDFASHQSAPMLVVRSNSVPSHIVAYILGHADTIDAVSVVGDETQVSSAVELLIKQLI